MNKLILASLLLCCPMMSSDSMETLTIDDIYWCDEEMEEIDEYEYRTVRCHVFIFYDLE